MLVRLVEGVCRNRCPWGTYDVGNVTTVLGRVNITKIILPGSMILQIRREKRQAQIPGHVIHKSLALFRRASVEAVETEPDESVVGLADKRRRHGSGNLDVLERKLDAANVDNVGVDLAARARAVFVGNVPFFARNQRGRCGFLGLVDVVALLGLGAELAGKYPLERG